MTSLEKALASIADVMFPGDDVPRPILLSTKAADGDTPLRVFAWRKDLESAQILLAAGADSNAIGDMGETPLHVAVRNKQVELARALLAAGASPDIVSEFEETPQRAAAHAGEEMAALFSQFGT